ncbi:MAG TPA: hypothetical protein VHE55_15985 [Fimbriimonadaceae bacterium]|nr:hypothetical protein [Fimbriimonadaceae bacterium]
MTDFEKRIVAAYISDDDSELRVSRLLCESCTGEERQVLLILSHVLGEDRLSPAHSIPLEDRITGVADACGITVEELVALLRSAGQRIPIET